MRSFSFSYFNKTDSIIDSPADTCGCGVPEGLEMSLVFHYHSEELSENSSASV